MELIVSDLGSKVVSNVTLPEEVLDLKMPKKACISLREFMVIECWKTHEKRYVALEHEPDLRSQRCTLGEVDEVFKRKGERDVLRHLDENTLDGAVLSF